MYSYLSRHKAFSFYFFSLLQVFLITQSYSATIRSAGSGEWGTATTWSPAQIPTAADVVIISNVEASIYDVQGKKWKTSVFSPNEQISISVNEFSKGVYFLELKKNTSNELIGRSKFVVGI